MRKYTIQDIDKMDGHEFEYFCAELLKKNGYDNVKVTPGSGDQGIDIIAHKDGIKFGIQCKCYSSDIGNKAVQEAFSGKEFYKCHIGVVFSNRYFTGSAIELAKRNRILLWDRSYLITLLKNTDLLYEDIIEDKTLCDISTDKTQSIEIVVESGSNDGGGIDNTEQDIKFDIFISVNNKHIIKNSIMREKTAREISRLTGISSTHASASLFRYPSRLMSNLSKEEAERIVDRLKTITGCTVYLKESKGPSQESAFSRITGELFGLLIIILGIISPVMTKVCWDWEHRIGNGFGIFTLLFVILTLLTSVPTLLFISSILFENKPIDDGNDR